jgi:hypothetical protein
MAASTAAFGIPDLMTGIRIETRVRITAATADYKPLFHVAFAQTALPAASLLPAFGVAYRTNTSELNLLYEAFDPVDEKSKIWRLLGRFWNETGQRDNEPTSLSGSSTRSKDGVHRHVAPLWSAHER